MAYITNFEKGGDYYYMFHKNKICYEFFSYWFAMIKRLALFLIGLQWLKLVPWLVLLINLYLILINHKFTLIAER